MCSLLQGLMNKRFQKGGIPIVCVGGSLISFLCVFYALRNGLVILPSRRLAGNSVSFGLVRIVFVMWGFSSGK